MVTSAALSFCGVEYFFTKKRIDGGRSRCQHYDSNMDYINAIFAYSDISKDVNSTH